MRELYPEIEPYAVHNLETGDGHVVYVEECGNPDGIPVLFLHGGPGAGCKRYHRQFFDPARYRAILFDQRGCGRSRPEGELRANTTRHLLEDMERIRLLLKIDRWLLFGGSWGSTLALLYAQRHTPQVAGMVLRGVFLARRRDVEWFAGEDGVRRIYPESWRRLEALIPLAGRDDPIAFIHGQLNGPDELARWRVAREWLRWGGQVALGDAFDPAAEDPPPGALHQARIEAHYSVHGYFIGEDEVLRETSRIAAIPATILQGQRDLTCPAEGADALHRALPDSTLEILPQAGHIAATPDMIDALVRAADAMAERLGP
jgi:proline iminopeptidase